VVVAAAVNEATDLAHPETDELSFDFHPARRLPGMSAPVRRAGCGVARVATVSGVGPQGILAFYSNFGNAFDGSGLVDALAAGQR
jgi:hypothetical protein